MERSVWHTPAVRVACVSCLALLPALSGCTGHLTSSVARTHRYITYVQRAVEYRASDTLIDCRPAPDGVSQLCEVIHLDGSR